MRLDGGAWGEGWGNAAGRSAGARLEPVSGGLPPPKTVDFGESRFDKREKGGALSAGSSPLRRPVLQRRNQLHKTALLREKAPCRVLLNGPSDRAKVSHGRKGSSAAHSCTERGLPDHPAKVADFLLRRDEEEAVNSLKGSHTTPMLQIPPGVQEHEMFSSNQASFLTNSPAWCERDEMLSRCPPRDRGLVPTGINAEVKPEKFKASYNDLFTTSQPRCR
ncbi:hypothetical protein L209DRAFT_742833 [Thermothelomyces heterothallicus CBS 203.75]